MRRITLTRREMCAGVVNPVRRLPHHAVDQPLDHPKLAHRVSRGRPIKQSRVERGSKRFQFRTHMTEHQFVLYRTRRRKAPKNPMFSALFRPSPNETGKTKNQKRAARPPSLRSFAAASNA